MNLKTIIHYCIIAGLLVSIIASAFLCSAYFQETVSVTKRPSLYYQSESIYDKYSSTFHLDVNFSTQEPEFLVRKNIDVSVSLKRIYNESSPLLYQIQFALVTSEGHNMPFQGTHKQGVLLEDIHENYFRNDYTTHLDFSGEYSCRLIIKYVIINATNPSDSEFVEDVIYVGPIMKIEPVSVDYQIKWTAMQVKATNKTIALAFLIIILTLIMILITWLDKQESLFHDWDNFKKK